jgi:hypothetical protein
LHYPVFDSECVKNSFEISFPFHLMLFWGYAAFTSRGTDNLNLGQAQNAESSMPPSVFPAPMLRPPQGQSFINSSNTATTPTRYLRQFAFAQVAACPSGPKDAAQYLGQRQHVHPTLAQ